jgi:hypothetical protein
MKKKPLIFDIVKSVIRIVKFGLAIATGLVVLCFLILYKLGLSIDFAPEAVPGREPWQNVTNSEKGRIGMQEEQVLHIMGKPDRINSYGPKDDKWWNHQGVKSYHYHPPDLASDGIDIWMDTTDTVVHVTHFEL